MTTKSDAGFALRVLVEDIGCPNKLVFDRAKEQNQPGTNFMKSADLLHIKTRESEPYSPCKSKT